jgi:hypothetical protein
MSNVNTVMTCARVHSVLGVRGRGREAASKETTESLKSTMQTTASMRKNTIRAS